LPACRERRRGRVLPACREREGEDVFCRRVERQKAGFAGVKREREREREKPVLPTSGT